MARIGVRVEATEENTQQRDYGNLPNGDYRLEISASEVKETGEGTRDHKIVLKVTYDVIEPDEFKGRKLFGNYNLQNPNSQAQDIGQRQFACLLRAMELNEAPEDSDELHFVAFMAKIGMGKPSKDGQYEARNEIKKYYYPDEGNVPAPSIDANQPVAANDNKPAPQRQSQAAAKPAAAATGARRPWGSK